MSLLFLHGFVCVSLYSPFLWLDLHFNLWIGQEHSLPQILRTIHSSEKCMFVSVWAHCAGQISLPWDLFLLLQGASLLRLSVKRFSQCCSHYRLQTDSSRDLQRLERDLKVGQNLPCEDTHYFDFLHFHFQQTEGRFLFLSHWKR